MAEGGRGEEMQNQTMDHFLTFVIFVDNDFVHVDVFLICTCKETGDV